MPFVAPLDIANRALQYVGARRLVSLTDNTKSAGEVSFCYDKLRRAELRRGVWRFATRRATLRPLTATSLQLIPPIWNNATNYLAGQLVRTSDGIYWIASVANFNSGPSSTPQAVGFPPFWQQFFGSVIADIWAGTYNAGEIAIRSGVFYLSTRNANTVDPTTDNTHAFWVPLGGTTQPVALLQPFGAGVSVLSRLRTAYPLPYGFLRLAAPDPKVESTDTLVTSGAVKEVDWQLEGNYLVSSGTDPLLLRFVADLQDVTQMDDLFCEALAARIAYSLCEPLTQSTTKLQAISAAYRQFVSDARLINWIETGNTEPEEEAYSAAENEAGAQKGRG